MVHHGTGAPAPTVWLRTDTPLLGQFAPQARNIRSWMIIPLPHWPPSRPSIERHGARHHFPHLHTSLSPTILKGSRLVLCHTRFLLPFEPRLYPCRAPYHCNNYMTRVRYRRDTRPSGLFGTLLAFCTTFATPRWLCQVTGWTAHAACMPHALLALPAACDPLYNLSFAPRCPTIRAELPATNGADCLFWYAPPL